MDCIVCWPGLGRDEVSASSCFLPVHRFDGPVDFHNDAPLFEAIDVVFTQSTPQALLFHVSVLIFPVYCPEAFIYFRAPLLLRCRQRPRLSSDLILIQF